MKPDPISDIERRDRLRLIRTATVGPITWRKLMDHFGSTRDALDGLPELAGRAAGEILNVPDMATADAELAQLEACAARLLTLDEPDYPTSLAQIDDAPPTLAVRGDIAIFSEPGIGVVGARNASVNGQRLAETMARDLATADIAIISGLARGIDTAAHHGALAAHGQTVAVMASGVDIVYLPENQALYDRIADQGAVISETPPGLRP